MHPLLVFLFVFLVLFSPENVSGAFPERRDDSSPGHEHRNHCLKTDEAERLRDLWISFFVKVTDGGAEIRKSVTDDFKFFSESLNFATPGRTLPVCSAIPCRLLSPAMSKDGRAKGGWGDYFHYTIPIPLLNLLIWESSAIA